MAKRFDRSRFGIITRRRILYWLAAVVAVFAVGMIIGLIWADTSDVAGFIAVVTNIAGGVGIVFLLIALAVVTRRQRHSAYAASGTARARAKACDSRASIVRSA